MNLEIIKNTINEIKKAQCDNYSIQDAVKKIKIEYEKYWEEERLPELKKIAELVNDGIPTPVLTVCGRGTQELRFTKYFAYLLNPKNEHGLGAAILQSIFGKAQLFDDIDDNWENVNVETEYNIGKFRNIKGHQNECYCDICIMSDRTVVIVEHKIVSGYSAIKNCDVNQLERYNTALKNNIDLKNKNIHKFLLVPYESRFDDNEDWQIITHISVIEACLPLLKNVTISETAKGNLLRFLIDISLGPYEEYDNLINKIKTITFNVLNNSQFDISLLNNYLSIENKTFMKILRGVLS